MSGGRRNARNARQRRELIGIARAYAALTQRLVETRDAGNVSEVIQEKNRLGAELGRITGQVERKGGD